ncbi:sugar phosphate isomerase/epimerase [Cryobacterium glaciale]|uniref:Sugar phosphate isomerase/epimerase n=1 Tax=Cryobacterium glaciale TaxID=1259145 RepID=A0A4R8V0N2_9MICO|nr:sugar phosphate isomerase/epimerase family protein [Cryobacterium glaciale]TFB74386.1 sugar phosphate isomerase/epimerase [Cryobacterium glaciale]
MLVGIDSYSFHRYFGEVYPQQADPGKRWDMKDDFVPFAVSLDVDEVALETLFYPAFDDNYCAALKDKLDEANLRRVIGWGHPDGLHRGQDTEALADLINHIPRAKNVGATTMRIVASSMLYVDEPHDPQVKASITMLRDAVRAAEDNGVTLALENHIDFTSLEILEIIQTIDSENLRVNFDTGNSLRLFENPVEAAKNLAPYTIATHTKDITTAWGGSPSERFLFWPSCPVGEGLIDFLSIARVLVEAGFDGSLAVELDLIASPWDEATEEANVTQGIRYLKSIVAQLDAEQNGPTA